MTEQAAELPQLPTVRFVAEGRILSMRLENGPMNMVNAQLHEDLAQAFRLAGAHRGSDLIVLTGSGRAFCAGGDAEWLGAMSENPALFRAIAADAKRIVFDLIELEKPVICRLNGPAAGLGASIALLCDVVIAAESASIGDPHVRMGLVAGDGGAVIWPLLIGLNRAKELLMTGEMLSAERALELGLLNHLVPDAELDAKVAEVASAILANPRWAVRWTKTVANLQLREVAQRLMDPAIAYEIASNTTADHREAVRAFREKRQAEFFGD